MSPSGDINQTLFVLFAPVCPQRHTKTSLVFWFINAERHRCLRTIRLMFAYMTYMSCKQTGTALRVTGYIHFFRRHFFTQTQNKPCSTLKLEQWRETRECNIINLCSECNESKTVCMVFQPKRRSQIVSVSFPPSAQYSVLG